MKATFSRPLWTTWTNCVRVCSISVALSFCSLAPSSARADQAADVSAILSLLQQSYQYGWFTIPYSNESVSDLLADYLGRGLFLNGTGSPYGAIVAALLGGSVNITTNDTSTNAIGPTLRRVEALLRAQPTYTNDLDVINGALMGIMDYQGYYLPSIRDIINYAAGDLNYLLAGWVAGGQYSNAWDVALVPDQLDEFRQMLQALEYTSGTSGETIVGAIEDATRTNAAIAGDLHALRLGLLDEYDTIDTVEEHADTVSEYVDEEVETNALAALTISPGDAGDLSPVLDLVDPDAFDVLPSLSGGDPVVQVFTPSRSSNLPAFSIDFSLPSGFRTFVHAVCVWIWRMLFFLAMWRLVNEEYGYWSTLGGSAG